MQPAKRSILAAAVTAAVTFTGIGFANTGILDLQQDPNQWVMQNGNYASTRYSALDQITDANVKDLKVAWTFSTGVLRGHEGGPLVIGDVMYVHTPFPNKVFALDLNNEGKPRRASSATSTPIPTTASSTSRCCPAWAAGPGSAWPPA